MKKLMIFATAAVAVVGCSKTNVEDGKPAFANEIQLTSNVLATNETKTTDYTAAFSDGSKIYMWSYDFVDFAKFAAADLETDPVAKEALLAAITPYQTALGYSYGEFAWNPSTSGEFLIWKDMIQNPADKLGAKPLVLVGVHPQDPTVISATANNAITYSIQKEQSTLESYVKSDVMWAAHTGTTFDGVEGTNNVDLTPPDAIQPVAPGIGISKPVTNLTVPLKFHHLTAAIDFKIRFTQKIKDAPSTEAYTNVKVKSIKFVGPEVATTATLNLWSGLLTPIIDDNKTISWTPKDGLPFEDNLILKQTTFNENPDANHVFTDLTTLLTIPNTYAADGGSKIQFAIDYDYYKGTGTNPTLSIKDKIYTWDLGVTKFDKFPRNTISNLKVYIQLNSNQIQITSSIVDWTTNTAIDEEIKPI